MLSQLWKEKKYDFIITEEHRSINKCDNINKYMNEEIYK